MIVVSNTSPITNLAAIKKLDLLQQLYNSIIIPQAVYNEMAGDGDNVPGSIEVQTLPWILSQPVKNRTLVTKLLAEIDPGESEAIVLAIELKADRLIIDDYQGRIIASRFGLKFVGLLGILLVAKRRGLINQIKPIIDALINQAGFFLSNQLYGEVIKSAGE